MSAVFLNEVDVVYFSDRETDSDADTRKREIGRKRKERDPGTGRRRRRRRRILLSGREVPETNDEADPGIDGGSLQIEIRTPNPNSAILHQGKKIE